MIMSINFSQRPQLYIILSQDKGSFLKNDLNLLLCAKDQSSTFEIINLYCLWIVYLRHSIMETIVLQKNVIIFDSFQFVSSINFLFFLFFGGVMNRQITIPIINA
jgi:hypothetical protein